MTDNQPPEDPSSLNSPVGAGPREVAWQTLRAARRGPAVDAQGELTARAHAAKLSARDQALAFEIAQGVLRWQRRLDAVAAALEGFQQARIEPDVADVLRTGVYQHAFLDRVPAHALVHETVALARKLGGGPVGGFVNAALQQMLRQFPDRSALAKFAAQLPPDVSFSMPPWLFRLLKREARTLAAHPAEDLQVAIESLNAPLPLYLRTPRASEACDLAARLTRDGVEARPRPDLAPACIEVPAASAARLLGHALFAQGAFAVQDASAQLTAVFVGPEPGETILDWCAAPGGKTAALAHAMGRRGRLVAMDPSRERLERLVENLRQLGLEEFVEVNGEKPDGPEPPPLADCVLVDAPCSGLGTLRRHPEIRWRVRRRDLERLAGEQLAILHAASRFVRPGGRLVYSTCSMAAEENERVIERFLEQEEAPWKVDLERDGLDEAAVRRLGADGWLRALPWRDPMDSARAVRLRAPG